MIAHISPADRQRDESRNTLVYADRAKNISNKVSQLIYWYLRIENNKSFFVCTSVVQKMFGNKYEIFDVSSFHYEKKLEVIYARRVLHMYTNSPESDLENIHWRQRKKIPTRLTIASYHAMGDSHVAMQSWP